MIGGVSSASPRLELYPASAYRRGNASNTERESRVQQGHASPAKEAVSADGLSEQERLIVAELQRTDREVRAHEQAHMAAAGPLALGVSYTYEAGPDRQQYAIAGELGIDTSAEEGDPEATIRKAEQIQAAANAPAKPSSQDRQVAALAARMAQTARADLAREKVEESSKAEPGQKGAAEAYEEPVETGTLLDLVA